MLVDCGWYGTHWCINVVGFVFHRKHLQTVIFDFVEITRFAIVSLDIYRELENPAHLLHHQDRI